MVTSTGKKAAICVWLTTMRCPMYLVKSTIVNADMVSKPVIGRLSASTVELKAGRRLGLRIAEDNFQGLVVCTEVKGGVIQI